MHLHESESPGAITALQDCGRAPIRVGVAGCHCGLMFVPVATGGNISLLTVVFSLSISTLPAPSPGAATLVLSSPCQGMFAPAAPEVSGASFYPAMPPISRKQ
jgi:hypothetical protein